ncbi:signal recognition particle [Salinisphaera orenii MK-B5]|uniref:Signal recognition particle protein n=2 Tax=Salinisphaera orenii TaxID=856731 RepID=A0A423PTZ3_9GAMM|nr:MULTISPECIES: signal recognition particle protein [Salinisphaera]ROO29038.1 signal recognition particle [Salinisphaera orenii MK-B5]ROO37456.1 signal recognition particle [Salinisphaera halophila YIM 95161]
MFDSLSDRLNRSFQTIRGRGRLTEDNIKATLREVRMALLEADVALPVVKQFVDDIRERAVGSEVMTSLTPGQALIKIVRDELTALLGESNESLDLRAKPPAVVLMAGLQGSGKTTSTGKLARYLKQREKKNVLVVSTDVYRPAAIDQLERVASDVGADFHPSASTDKPQAIAKSALEAARRGFYDVLIVDTAGRLGIDEAMMAEISGLNETLKPAETLFVVDAMTGQDAANTAKAFGDALPLTGVVLTKVDGDARGGAALSVRQITGRPIKFLGTGEKLEALEPFHPDRVASRILGMGDVLSLVEEAEQKVDQDKAEKLAKKLKKGKGFDLNDLADQLRQMQEMGGLGALMEKMPGGGQMPKGMAGAADETQVKRMLAIVDSMTPQERAFPDVIKSSRKRRIAGGSGTQVQDVNRLLKQHVQMRKMMKKLKGGGMKKMMRAMQGMGGQGGQGGLPPGMGGGGGSLPPGMGR